MRINESVKSYVWYKYKIWHKAVSWLAKIRRWNKNEKINWMGHKNAHKMTNAESKSSDN